MPDRESEQIFEHFSIRSRPTRHTDNSIGYRVEAASGKSVVYSGDTGFSEAVIELAKGADLLILEASFPDGHGVEGHLTPYEAGRMAALAGVGRLCLTHFYPESLTADIGAQCRKAYDGELILGRDLLHLHV
jgi:ribonuclease BN (tRNA processing enzyme)